MMSICSVIWLQIPAHLIFVQFQLLSRELWGTEGRNTSPCTGYRHSSHTACEQRGLGQASHRPGSLENECTSQQTPRTAVCALRKPHTASLTPKSPAGPENRARPGLPWARSGAEEQTGLGLPWRGPSPGPGRAQPRPRAAQSGQGLIAWGRKGPSGGLTSAVRDAGRARAGGSARGSRQAAAAALRLLPPPQPGWGGQGRGLGRRAPELARAVTCATGPRARHAVRGSRGCTPRPQPRDGAGPRLRGRLGAGVGGAGNLKFLL